MEPDGSASAEAGSEDIFDPFLTEEEAGEEAAQAEPGAEEGGSLRDRTLIRVSEKPRTVLITESAVQSVLRDPVRTGSSILTLIGGALCLVWLTEILLLWFPLNLRTAAWTFGTVVQTVDSLPSAAVGGALLSYGLIRHPLATTRLVRRLSTVFAGLTVSFVVIGVFYLGSLPSSFAEAPGVVLPPLRRTVAQTLIGLLVAIGTCWGVARALWRGVKAGRARGASQGREVPFIF